MIVLDVTDPAQPKVAVEEETDRTVVSFAVFDNVLFCSGKGALEIYELSALPMMRKVSVLEGTVGGSTLIVDGSGKHLFLSGWDKGFDIVDFSDLEKPIYVSGCGCEYHSDDDEWSDRNNVKSYGITQMEKRGDFLIAIAMECNVRKHREALLICDVQRLEEPRLLSRISTSPIRTHAMAVSGDYAFAGGYEKILSIDIKQPEEPEIVGEIELRGVCEISSFQEKTAYMFPEVSYYHQTEIALSELSTLPIRFIQSLLAGHLCLLRQATILPCEKT